MSDHRESRLPSLHGWTVSRPSAGNSLEYTMDTADSPVPLVSPQLLAARIASPCLIRRVIDPRATFHYVSAAQGLDAARRLVSVACDSPGAPVAQVGTRRSLDAPLVGGFALQLPAPEIQAGIVRGADTDRLALAPQSAGLLAVSLGLSRLHADDDHAMLAAAMPVYDALYAAPAMPQ